jgi:hypothetical protein
MPSWPSGGSRYRLRFFASRASLPKQAIRIGCGPFAGYAESCLQHFVRPLLGLGWASRCPALALEGLEVFSVDGPHWPQPDAKETLPDQQPADVAFRCLQFPSRLSDGEQTISIDAQDISTAPQQFLGRRATLRVSLD